jgi:carboxymethylenebutenolidase
VNGLLFAPDDAGPHPALILLPEVFGVNAAMREIATDFAARGYGVLLFDLYWRSAPGTALDYDDAGTQQARHLHEALDYDDALAGIRHAAIELRAQPWCDGRVAVIGFCLGGTLAYRSACAGFVDAAVAYYGTRIDRYLAEVSASIAPLLLHVGEGDHFTPPAVRARCTAAFAPYKQIETYLYDGAGHAFANPYQNHHHPAAAALADARTRDFLTQHAPVSHPDHPALETR